MTALAQGERLFRSEQGGAVFRGWQARVEFGMTCMAYVLTRPPLQVADSRLRFVT